MLLMAMENSLSPKLGMLPTTFVVNASAKFHTPIFSQQRHPLPERRIIEMSKKLFIAAIEVRTGEEQYMTYKLVPDATTEEEAENRVLNYFGEFLEPVSPESPRTFSDPKGYPHYSLDFVSPIETVSDLFTVISKI